MSELLLKTIVERLEEMKIASLKENNTTDPALQNLLTEIRLLQRSVVKLPLKLEENSYKMDELIRGVRQLEFNLSRPINEQIKHHHHLHKGIWISIGLFIISLLLSYGWIECFKSKKVIEANDMKYRYLKVNGNVTLLKLLSHTDSLYNINNDFFTDRMEGHVKRFGSEGKMHRPAVKLELKRGRNK